MDVVAGSKAELNLVRSLRDYLSSLGFTVKLHPVEVVSWNEVECLINGSIPCTAQPPQRSAYVSGILGREFLLTPTTGDPDNMWIVHGKAGREGYKAVIFYDSYPNVKKRRIVLTGELSYSMKSRVKDDVLGVHVPLDVGLKLKELQGKLIDIEVKTNKTLSVGYNLEATCGENPKITLAAHHDRWLNGFRDNVNGLLVLLKLAKRLSEKSSYSVRIMSFTAEEYGDPEEPMLYWAYGSRTYFSRYKEVFDDNLLFVVIDTAFTEPVELSYIGLDERIGSYIALSTVESDTGIAYTDALSVLEVAVPTIVLHNLHAIKPVYHSDKDVFIPTVNQFNEKMVNSLMKLVELANLKKQEVINMTSNYISKHVKHVETADPLRTFKCFVKHMLLVVNKGSYDELNSELAVMACDDLKNRAGQVFTLLKDDTKITTNSTQFKEFYSHIIREFVECLASDKR